VDGPGRGRDLRAKEPVSREVLARVVGPQCNLDLVIADIRGELRGRPYDLVAVAGGWHLPWRPGTNRQRVPREMKKIGNSPGSRAGTGGYPERLWPIREIPVRSGGECGELTRAV
jgi:hypothetical protein